MPILVTVSLVAHEKEAFAFFAPRCLLRGVDLPLRCRFIFLLGDHRHLVNLLRIAMQVLKAADHFLDIVAKLCFRMELAIIESFDFLGVEFLPFAYSVFVGCL